MNFSPGSKRTNNDMSKAFTNEELIEMITNNQDLVLKMVAIMEPDPEIEKTLEAIVEKQREIDATIDRIIEASDTPGDMK